ncbi:M23 family metallopeptidase [Belliella sp. DSM 111904]|uniref:M23 family metallopeptidase n=1 Tax=Belliella filtrata TaxID=2923435 RepID=A0ABS9V4W3_9BACT|nr:M23 family metallopeptidase [Belliella filtrata]MCH7411438.1 M23 family metallopeptidase [Belliella filtrata]
MIKSLILAVFSLIVTHTYAEQEVKVYTVYDKNGDATIVSENSDIVTYSIGLEFLEVENLDTSSTKPSHFEVAPGKTNLMVVKASNPNHPTKIEYVAKILKGRVHSDSGFDVPYLIPIDAGEYVSVEKVNKLSDFEVDHENIKGIGITFYFSKPLPIRAPRKGVISTIVDGEDESNNFLEIYHVDGTITHLEIFKSGSALVKVGDTVYPGMKIASSVNEEFEGGPQVRMLRKVIVASDVELEQKAESFAVVHSEKSTIRPENGFKMLSVHPENWVNLELSKKEIRAVQNSR